MQELNCSVALLAATDTEWAAVHGMYDDWQEHIHEDGLTYLETKIFRDGKEHRVIAVRQPEMGMLPAAVTTMGLISSFRPKYVFMVGIAAGVANNRAMGDNDEQIYGDVIVAEQIWYHGEGKFVSPDKAEIHFGNIGFIPRPKHIELLDSLRPYVESAIASPQNEYHAVIGEMTCGNSVIACEEILEQYIHARYSKSVGLDMESYAVAYAARHAAPPRPEVLIIKSVSDFAGGDKNDSYQRFAAMNSCAFAKLLYEQFLPFA